MKRLLRSSRTPFTSHDIEMSGNDKSDIRLQNMLYRGRCNQTQSHLVEPPLPASTIASSALECVDYWKPTLNPVIVDNTRS